MSSQNAEDERRSNMRILTPQTSAYDVIIDKYKATIIGEGIASGTGDSLLDVIDDITNQELSQEDTQDRSNSQSAVLTLSSVYDMADSDDDDELSEDIDLKLPASENVSQPVSLETLNIPPVNLPPEPDFSELDEGDGKYGYGRQQQPAPPARTDSAMFYEDSFEMNGRQQNLHNPDTDEQLLARRRLFRRTYIFCWLIVATLLIALISILVKNKIAGSSTPVQDKSAAPTSTEQAPVGPPPTASRPTVPPPMDITAPTLTPSKAPTVAPSTVGQKQRSVDITREIITNGVTAESVLFNVSTPQYQALQWLIDDDSLQVPANYSGLIQRYVLATVYFSTEGDRWKSCSRPVGNDSLTCFADNVNYRFLSGVYECQWFGIACTRINARNEIRSIDLGGNKLRGTLPSEITFLPGLLSLALRGNELVSQLPPNLKALSNLQTFSVANNDFTGSIPTDMFPSSLQSLDLETNYFTGSIPNDIFENCKDLQDVDLSGNKLLGTIDSKWGTLDKLSSLKFSNNNLTGTLPSEIFTPVMEVFAVELNNLTGTIPDAIFTSTSLRELYLDTNDFRGTISSRFGELKQLEYLVLFHNRLTGQIPKEIGNMMSLVSFQIPYNYVNGSVPSEVCALTPKPLENLWTDCKTPEGGGAPKVTCDCCSTNECFFGY